MAARKSSPAPSFLLTPRIFTATRGALGRVIRGVEITEAEAVAVRRASQDIVVCGGDVKQNRALARHIENQVGPNEPDPPHAGIGPYALPHFHQVSRDPEGHAFYETGKRRAARNP